MSSWAHLQSGHFHLWLSSMEVAIFVVIHFVLLRKKEHWLFPLNCCYYFICFKWKSLLLKIHHIEYDERVRLSRRISSHVFDANHQAFKVIICQNIRTSFDDVNDVVLFPIAIICRFSFVFCLHIHTHWMLDCEHQILWHPI